MRSTTLLLGGLALGLAVGYFVEFIATSRPRIVETSAAFEMQFDADHRCTMPAGTVLEHEYSDPSKGFSRYVLYVNVHDSALPTPHPSARRWFKAPVWAYAPDNQ